MCSEQHWVPRRDSVVWLRVETTWPAEVMTCARSAGASVSSHRRGVPGSQRHRSLPSNAAEPLPVITMAMPSATATAMNATSSNRSMASREQESDASYFLHWNGAMSKTLNSPGSGRVGGKHKLSAQIMFIPQNGNKFLLPLNTAYKDCWEGHIAFCTELSFMTKVLQCHI